MGGITKVDYPKLAEIYSKKGHHAAKEYLRNNGVKAPIRAINRMKEKYMYDEELKKYIVPADAKPRSHNKASVQKESDTLEGFMSIEEICESSGYSPSPIDEEYNIPFPNKTREEIKADMYLDTLTEYTKYIQLDKYLQICHINKTELLRAGFEVVMY